MLTVEENNILAMYENAGELRAALPHMDEEMRLIATSALEKAAASQRFAPVMPVLFDEEMR